MAITVEFVNVTPTMAAKWKETTCDVNRKLSKVFAKKYAQDMAEGKWRENGVPIIFGKNGKLLDGQHRLEALCISGKTIRFMVVRGVDEKARHTLDNGKRRNSYDQLLVAGLKASRDAAQALSLLIKLKKDPINEQAVEPGELIAAYVNLGEEMEAACTRTRALLKAGGQKSCNAFEIATYFLFWKTQNAEKVSSFFDKLYSGVGIPKNTSFNKIRSEIAGSKDHIQRVGDHYQKLGVITRAFRDPGVSKYNSPNKSDIQELNEMISLVNA